MPQCKHHNICGREDGPFSDEGFCILHSQDPNKDRSAFAEALLLHRKEKGADFSYMFFPDFANFSEALFTSPISFSGARFLKGAFFFKATFEQETNFFLADFCQGADFRNATFAGKVYFNEVTFTKDTDFDMATFSEEAYFMQTVFSGPTSFFRATFTKDACFTKTSFAQKLNCLQTKFTQKTYFNGAKFSEEASFGETAFADEVWFTQSRFIQKASFGGASFSQKAWFCGTLFAEETSFNRSVFNQDAIFVGARFTHGADFSGATFSAKVIFRESKFFGQMLFTPQRIFASGGVGKDQKLIFSGVEVDFRAVTISPIDALILRDTDLQKCRFLDTDLRKAEITGARWPKIRGRFCIYDEMVPLAKGETRPWSRLERLYRELKQSYEDRHDYERAGDFHYGEKEMRRKNPDTPLSLRFFLTLYWAVSGYGERYLRPLVWAAALLVVSTVSYLWLGLEGKWTGGRTSMLSMSHVGDWLQAAHYSFRTMIFLKPEDVATPVGYSRSIHTMQSLLGPLFLGFFALAIRQRLKR